MDDLAELFERNRAWSAAVTAADPQFFANLAEQQSPDYLWIGCSDSRVPANTIVDLDPGELFVHRNVANLASPQDANYLSVLQFAVDVLKVRHIMVVGHYGCGGVSASLKSNSIGAPPIARAGTPEVKARALPEILSGKKISALAITEPSGGSDVANLRTSARRDGDFYVVNGEKTFITSGMRADYITTAVRTGGPGRGGARNNLG